MSDYFWPFFTNHSYEEIILAVLHTLNETQTPDLATANVAIPQELKDSFGQHCKEYKLLDEEGRFNDADRLVGVFCGTVKK